MTIDTPRPEQISGLRELWKEAFGDSDVFLDGFFATGFSPNRCRMLDWNGRCAAALYWFDCSYRGQTLAYIYAVATLKDFQGNGFCRRLMEDTHRHLQQLGYAGTILVPGNSGLFSLYKKLGYTEFCPMVQQRIAAEGVALPLKAVSPEQYSLFRKAMLPHDAVEQTGIEYLATFTRLYSGEGCLFSIAQEGRQAFFQEYLGDPKLLPRILRTLGAEEGTVFLPGGEVPRAMYYSWSSDFRCPGYFGLSFS